MKLVRPGFCKFLIAVVAALAGFTEYASPQTPGGPALPLDPAIRYGKLTNGLTYYIRVNKKPEHRAELRLALNTGSILEDDDQLGLAHIVEHMAFNGTKNFRRQALVNYLESVGLRFGPDLNASTGFDETIYMLQISTDSAHIVEKAFDILEDWAHQVSFEPEEIDKERGVVLEEWRLGRGAEARIRDKQLPVLLKNSRYADRLPIGTAESIEHFQHAALTRFYSDWYRPDLMAVVAIGDFDPNTIEAFITKHFSPLQGPAHPRPRQLFPVPDHPDTLYTIETDPELDMTFIGLDIKLDPASDSTESDYRRSLVLQLATAMFNSRLAEVARSPYPPFLQAYASRSRFVHTKDLYSASAIVKSSGVLEGIAALMKEQKRVTAFGFTAGELEREKKDLLRLYEQAYQERDKTESGRLASEYIRNFLYGEPVPGITFEFELARRHVPTITLEETNALWQSLQRRGNVVINVSGPQKPGVALPTAAALHQTLDSIAALSVTPYDDRVGGQSLLLTPPLPGRIVSEKTDSSLGLTEWTLSNGVRVFVKPTDFKNDEVLISGFSPGGTSLAAIDDYIPAMTSAAVIQEGGLGAFDRTQLEKLLAGKIASVSAYVSELEEGISGSASPRDLTTLFELIYLRFTAPRVDSAAFLSYATRMRGLIENRAARPESAFEDTMQVTLSQHHPRRQPVTTATIDKLNLSASSHFYRERFGNASDFTFIIVGSFTVQQLKPLVMMYLGGLPGAPRSETWKDVGVRFPDGIVKREVLRGIEPKSQVQLVMSGSFVWNQENRLRLGATAEALRIKLREALREEKGGTYGVSVGATPLHYPLQRYRLSIGFGCAPERVEELLQSALLQMDSLRTFGPDAATLVKVKEKLRRERETSLKQNGFWIGALQLLISNGENPEDILSFDRRAAALTPEIVREAARTYLNTSAYVLGVLKPQSGKP
jgi:zinc protease